MNAYSELLRYLKLLADRDDAIKTVTNGADIDLDKGNIFPLMNIDINDATFTGTSTVSFEVEIACLDLRHVDTKEDGRDKFYLNDNEIDNYNGTMAALQRLWTQSKRDYDNNLITASDSPRLQQITKEGVNLLDGWVMTFSVELPMTEINLCSGIC